MRISRSLLLGTALSLSLTSFGLSVINLNESWDRGESTFEAVRDEPAREPTEGWHVHPEIIANQKLLGRRVGHAAESGGMRHTRDILECDWDFVHDSDAEYPLCRLEVLLAAPCYEGDVLLRPALDYRTEPPTEVVGLSMRHGEVCLAFFEWSMPRREAPQRWHLFLTPYNEAP